MNINICRTCTRTKCEDRIKVKEEVVHVGKEDDTLQRIEVGRLKCEEHRGKG